MNRTLIAALALATLPLVSACTKEATGQVVAIVDGEEITLQEINAELAGAQIPEGADRKPIQQNALQRIIERRLAAKVARDEGIDDSPDYILRRRQLEDALLVQMLGQRLQRTVRVPDAAAIDKFIADNPTMFASRTNLQLDQIIFPTPANPQQLRSLEAANTMADVEATLRRLNIQFERRPAALDTATVPPQIVSQINALPAGEPFILPNGPTVTVNLLVGRTPITLAPAQARPIAIEAMRNRSLSEQLQSRLTAARTAAEIEYQDGFAPPANANRPGGAAAAATKGAAAPAAPKAAAPAAN